MVWVANGPVRVADDAGEVRVVNPGEPLPDDCETWRTWPHLVAAGAVRSESSEFTVQRQEARKAGARAGRPRTPDPEPVSEPGAEVEAAAEPAATGDVSAEQPATDTETSGIETTGE